MGACATGGGPFKEGYNVVSGIDKYLPVDVYVPGCPPTPEALLHGFMTLHEKFKRQSIRTVPWYRKEYSSEVLIPVLGPDIFDRRPEKVKQISDINMRRLMDSRISGRPTIQAIEEQSGSEQVVIHNSGLAQDMTGWKLAGGDDQEFAFPPGFVLMSDSSVRVLSGPKASTQTPSDLIWTQEWVWQGTAGTARLLDADGGDVTSLDYQS
jgi:hypothetical protein